MGEKDFQQFFLVKNYIENKYDTRVHVCKTVREKNKLALSSRNSLLNKKSFINSLSHDIYTPLNEIIGYAEILEEKSFGRSTLFEIIEIKKSCFAIRDRLQPLFDQSDDLTKQIKTEIKK